MREILFRGKRYDNGEWEYGHLVTGTYYLDQKPITAIMPSDLIFYPRSEVNGWEDVDPETIGQFTGLTDKNGKKIFEGDLCLCNRHIASSVDRQVFRINLNTQYGQWVGDSFCSNITADEFFMCEIIGNIHDNPELMDGGNVYGN